jgi:hypothetical protein
MLGIGQDNNADLEGSINLNDPDHEPKAIKLEPGKTMGSIPSFRAPGVVDDIKQSRRSLKPAI